MAQESISHDAQALLGLLFALAWGIAITWKISSKAKDRLDATQDIKLVEVVNNAKSNEENINALQTAINATISALNQNIFTLSQDLGDANMSIQQVDRKVDDTAATTLASANANTTTAVTNLESSLQSNLSSVQSNLQGDLSSVQSSLQTDLSSLQTQVNTHKGWVILHVSNGDHDQSAGDVAPLTWWRNSITSYSGVELDGNVLSIPGNSVFLMSMTLSGVYEDATAHRIYNFLRQDNGSRQSGAVVLEDKSTKSITTQTGILDNSNSSGRTAYHLKCTASGGGVIKLRGGASGADKWSTVTLLRLL